MTEGNYSHESGSEVKIWDLSSYKARYDSRHGIRLMLVAIIFLILSYIFRAVSVYYQSFEFTGISPEMYDLAMTLGWISVLLTGTFVIITIIALYILFHGKKSFTDQHSKNIIWSVIFLIGYIVVLASSIILSYLYMMEVTTSTTDDLTSSAYYYYSGFSQAFYILQNFFLGFIILLVVKEFASFRVKVLLFLFTGLIILIAFIDALIDIYDPYLFEPETSQDFANILILKAYFILIHAIIWAIAAIGYISVLSGFNVFRDSYPDNSYNYMTRLRPIRDLMRYVLTKPYIPLFAILVAASMIGAAAAEASQIPRRLGIITGIPMPENEDDWLIGEYVDSRILDEGESYDLDIEIDCNIIEIYFQLVWEDETDQPRRYNEPDSFSMIVYIDDMMKSGISENVKDGVGSVYIDWVFGEEYSYEANNAKVTIKLENAGDQVGPIGITGSPLVVQDTSNKYDLEVQWRYHN